jgi:hypothetical protein
MVSFEYLASSNKNQVTKTCDNCCEQIEWDQFEQVSNETAPIKYKNLSDNKSFNKSKLLLSRLRIRHNTTFSAI